MQRFNIDNTDIALSHEDMDCSSGLLSLKLFLETEGEVAPRLLISAHISSDLE